MFLILLSQANIIPYENVIGAAKLYLSSINGLGEDDVRISKRKSLSSRRLRGFEKNKVGPVDGSDFIGGITLPQ